MKRAYIPRDVLATEIRSGRVEAGNGPIGGALGGAAAGLATRGLEKAAASTGGTLEFPPCCSNCLAEDHSVQPIESVSTVNRGVPYTFRLLVPYCAACKDTANRKRLGALGLFAVFFAASVLIGIAVAIVGEVIGPAWLIPVSLGVGPVAGLAVSVAFAKARRPRAGQSSAHQAVFASALDIEFSGAPKGAVVSFANDDYADRFVAANRAIGVAAR